MKINFKSKRRNFELTGDDKSFVLSELTEVKEGKTKGKILPVTIGYYSSIESVLNKIVHLNIVDSDCSTFYDLLQAISDTKKYIAGLVSEKSEPADLVA